MKSTATTVASEDKIIPAHFDDEYYASWYAYLC